MPEETDLDFEWSGLKSRLNLKKHGISFEEAKTVFIDPCARLIADPDHSWKEDRYVLLGMSVKFRLLVVNHCYRKNESVIRIISARKAVKKEIRIYQEHLS